MGELALSSWSLHRALGPTYPGLDMQEGPRAPEYPYGQGTMKLLEAPAAVAEHGIRLLEICHFHFPRTDEAYLAELRERLAAAGVVPLTLLIDAGDISAADDEARERDMNRIRNWIDIAAAVGARQARVVAGLAQPSGEAVRRSSEGLASLYEYGAERSVRIITENWLTLSALPETLLAILDDAGKPVGLCGDFGNYKGAGKYDQLRQILPRATSLHAKAEFPEPGQMDEVDFRACLDLARAAGFDGPYVLIFDSPGDEWSGIDQIAGVVRPYLAPQNGAHA